MPITEERQAIQDLRDAGFSQRQAEVLAAKLEISAQATQQGLKDFIRQELSTRFAESDNKFSQFRQEVKAEFAQFRQEVKAEFAQVRAEMNTRFAEVNTRFAQTDVKIADLRTELHSSLRDQTLKLIAVLIAAISLAVAIIKIFPNAH